MDMLEGRVTHVESSERRMDGNSFGSSDRAASRKVAAALEKVLAGSDLGLEEGLTLATVEGERPAGPAESRGRASADAQSATASRTW